MTFTDRVSGDGHTMITLQSLFSQKSLPFFPINKGSQHFGHLSILQPQNKLEKSDWTYRALFQSPQYYVGSALCDFKPFFFV
jgi:NAD kinase